MVNQWSHTLPNPLGFKAYWSDKANDFKTTKGPQFDAFGNFMYGATGRADHIPGMILQHEANVAPHPGGKQSPINTRDIESGMSAINKGGTLSTRPYP
jgi:hypothetical protein